jgi:ribonuclease P protein component
MNKKFIISKNQEILQVIKHGNKKINDYFIIYNIESKNNFSRYCISVNKKYGNAVERNRIKRQIRNILTTNAIKNVYNYVIIIRPGIKGLKYVDIKKYLLELIGCE